MPKKQLNYAELSRKELELLKEIYVDQKVKSMSFSDLKNFATENISLQIMNTIGNEEELEAWQEMETFFKDEFENTIKSIKIKNESKEEEKTSLSNDEKKFETENKEDKKIDMWED